MAPPTLLKRFSPPAYLNDLEADKDLQGWSDLISQWMDDEITGAVGRGRTPLKQFFNGTKTAYDQSADPVHITWNAFPKQIEGDTDEERWKKADWTRDNQDEYLEWSLMKDDQDNIKTVTFTSEGPEYWQYIGNINPEKTFELIKRLNTPYLDNAPMSYFFYKDNGKGPWIYKPRSRHNLESNNGIIVHLIQDANTLGAEVDISAQATVIRQMNGKIVEDKDQLIHCSQYGVAGRNSDPKIGADINAAARQGWTLSVANPVALYMQSFDTSNLYLDTSGNRDGSNKVALPDAWIELQRGKGLNSRTPLALRLRIHNPSGQKTDDGKRVLDVSDIWDDTKQTNIRYGGQFAELIQIGVAGALGAKGNPPTLEDALKCYVRPPKNVAANGALEDKYIPEGEGTHLLSETHEIEFRGRGD